ncbi:MAG TPA: phage holin family protein [Gemmatimonadaceae bacterium]
MARSDGSGSGDGTGKGESGAGNGSTRGTTNGHAHRMPVDPNAGVPDLVGRLTDDSKRLVTGEFRLAKLEMHDGLKRGGQGAMWLGISLTVGVVGIVAFTLFVATLIGRIASGHMWLGAIIAAVIDLAIGVVLVRRGLAVYRKPSYSLEETRATLH